MIFRRGVFFINYQFFSKNTHSYYMVDGDILSIELKKIDVNIFNTYADSL